MLEFYNSVEHTARKKHMCFLCGEYIQPKDQYIRASGKYNGDFFDDCYHPSCGALITTFCDGKEEWAHDWVHDWIRERVCQDCPGYIEEMDGAFDCKTNCFRCEKVIQTLLGGDGDG